MKRTNKILLRVEFACHALVDGRFLVVVSYPYNEEKQIVERKDLEATIKFFRATAGTLERELTLARARARKRK